MGSQPARVHQVGIRDVAFGDDVTVVAPTNIYEAQIASGCFIGPFVEIQKNVRVGQRTRIQSHAFICEFVIVGDDCFISHGAMFINDTFAGGGPAGGDRSKWRQTVIGNEVSIGTNSTILPVTICSNVVIGAGSVVTKNIEKPGVYAGNPARFIRKI